MQLSGTITQKDFKPESSCIVRCEKVVIDFRCSQAFLFGGRAMDKIRLCECGCGEVVKWSRQKKRWNKFVHGHNSRGASFTTERREKIAKALLGNTNGKGIKLSKETKAKISRAHMGMTHTEESKAKISEAKKGIKHTEEQKIKNAIGHMKPRTDGYCDVWSDQEYKNDLRKSGCERCGITMMMSIHLFGCKLDTHHKNGKKECAPKDIMTVCHSCHRKVEVAKGVS